MLNERKIERVGEKFVNNYGNEFVIVGYQNAMCVTVEFECGYKAIASYTSCQKGEVSCPYDKRQCGVGCIGLKSDGTEPILMINGKPTKAYKLWMSMMNRVYNKKQLRKHPAYKNCKVCDRWLVFANFVEDLPNIPNYDIWLNREDYDLDKDMLQQGKQFKVYSPETCVFIPHNLNVGLSNRTPKAKKEKPRKLKKVIRVTDVETGVYVDGLTQKDIAEMFGFTQSYTSKLVKRGKCYLGYKIEVLYI